MAPSGRTGDGIGRLRDRFGGRVVALFVAYLELSVRDLLLGEGWPSDEIRRRTDLYSTLPDIAARRGIEYIDWPAFVRDSTRARGSIFDRMALHVDHGHLSPRGNRLRCGGDSRRATTGESPYRCSAQYGSSRSRGARRSARYVADPGGRFSGIRGVRQVSQLAELFVSPPVRSRGWHE